MPSCLGCGKERGTYGTWALTLLRVECRDYSLTYVALWGDGRAAKHSNAAQKGRALTGPREWFNCRSMHGRRAVTSKRANVALAGLDLWL